MNYRLVYIKMLLDKTKSKKKFFLSFNKRKWDLVYCEAKHCWI